MQKYYNYKLDVTLLITAIFITAFIVSIPTKLQAGPPLLCHPINIGNVKSLPTGNGPFGYNKNYNRKNLIKDALNLLDSDMPVLVRMETIRRAALYVTRNLNGSHGNGSYSNEDRALAFDLLSRLMIISIEAHNGKSNKIALFDAGYLMQCYREAGLIEGNRGYDWVQKANHLSGGNPEMEFALALMTKRNIIKVRQNKHLRMAKAGSEEGSLLALNLDLHFKNN